MTYIYGLFCGRRILLRATVGNASQLWEQAQRFAISFPVWCEQSHFSDDAFLRVIK